MRIRHCFPFFAVAPLALLLSGCATNWRHAHYTPSFPGMKQNGISPNYIQVLGPREKTTEGLMKAVGHEMQNGHVLIGSMAFWGEEDSINEIKKFAATQGCDTVLALSVFKKMQQGSRIVVTSHTPATYTPGTSTPGTYIPGSYQTTSKYTPGSYTTAYGAYGSAYGIYTPGKTTTETTYKPGAYTPGTYTPGTYNPGQTTYGRENYEYPVFDQWFYFLQSKGNWMRNRKNIQKYVFVTKGVRLNDRDVEEGFQEAIKAQLGAEKLP